MNHARFLVGDVFDRMAELPDGSVDLVLTSPPFLALRSYLPADHPDKGKEIGSERTPAEFVDTLLALSAEWRRLLAPHGSLCVELGDTFSGSGGAGGDYGEDGLREGQERFVGSGRMRSGAKDAPQEEGGGYVAGERVDRGFGSPIRNMDNKIQGGGPGWPLAKSLALVPEAYRFALAYGHNPHTGQPSPAGQWRVRNVIRWVRPNPPVGALGDKFRPATSEMVVAAVASDRYFDLDAVRGDPEDVKDQRYRTTNGPKEGADPSQVLSANYTRRVPSHPNGAPPLDWWKISPTGYAGAHYAVWPPELCVKPIKAMSPERVCVECGQPSRRIVEPTPEYAEFRARKNAGERTPTGHTDAVGNRDQSWDHHDDSGARGVKSLTVGWSDCGHDAWRPGLILDPFAGTGTTLAVATGHGRDAIGIDIDSRNAELARERVGDLFLDVDYGKEDA